jgi:serpin B
MLTSQLMALHIGKRLLLAAVVASCLGCASESEDGFERTAVASSQPIRAAVHSNLSVANKLAGVLRDEPGNLFYSPLSIEAVTGMLFAGAAGDTAAQLAVLLDAEGDPAALHAGLGALLEDLSRQHDQYTLSVANLLWALPELKSTQSFVDIARDNYNAPIEATDFADSEAAREEINEWVSDQTAGKIPELLRTGQITPDTVMAVVNAIYFKANWATAFDPELTRSDTFRRADASEVSVEMMSTPKTKLRIAIAGDKRWVELPYRTGEVSFIAYTRGTMFGEESAVVSVQALQDDLKDVSLEEAVDSLFEDELVVQLPKFSLRSRLDLVPLFKQLGVTDLFDARLADLSELSTNMRVSVEPFVHEAAVWVDEVGTVAAAATAAGIQRVSAPLSIRFDHPFLFFIRDNRTGAILFTGRVADPSENKAD